MSNPIKDKSFVTVTCDNCGAKIDIRYGTFRKTRNKPHYCRKCRGQMEKERINNLPEEERAAYLKQKNEAISRGWKNQSDETKMAVSKMRAAAWDNDERRAAHDKMLKDRWNNLTDEQKADKLRKMAEGKANYWSDPNHKEYHSNRARDKWYAQSEDEQRRILQALSDGREKFFENLTLAQREEIAMKRSESLHKYWNSLSAEEFETRLIVFRESLKHNFDQLNLNPNTNEKAFIEQLNANYIPYEFIWYNKTVYPDFEKMFPANPVKPGSSVSPYHAWDFKLMLYDGEVLVDVDGSIHDENCSSNMVTDNNGNRFVLADYIKFKDSQRPYQTDGLPAYVIQCYDDKLTDDTKVVDITTNEIMSFKSFIGLLTWMNLPDQEKIRIIESVK